ncbi:MAG: DUF1343 domain-containing protein [Deltaproteobacteria bacterium]|nr:DUF1343 domain-containing protein [Deltaproteobacteria bacterium]
MEGASQRCVLTGLDRVVASGGAPFRGQRVGLLVNQASVDAALVHAVDRFQAFRGDVRLVALFGPEHGVFGDAQDMEAVTDARDVRTGIALHSLYGATEVTLRPRPEALRGLDVVVCDLPDIGCRHYTFAATAAIMLEVCVATGVRFVVLDRPNPLGGVAVEGPLVDIRFRTFMNYLNVPIRHGRTLGELMAAHDARAEVIACEGWLRDADFDETGLPWVTPSPNLPTLDAAFVYPGACFIEATNLSEGRGTTRPFELIGAPFLDPWRFAEALAALELPGVFFRPTFFVPRFHKWAGQRCGAIQLHVTNRATFRPVLTGVALLVVARAQGGAAFAWRTEPYEFAPHIHALDQLAGSDALRLAVEAGQSPRDIAATWPQEA